MEPKKIELSWITSKNTEKAKAFFKDVIGLKLVEDQPDFGWLEFQGNEGGSVLGIGQSSADGDKMLAPGQNAIVTFTVDNIEECKKELESKNVPFLGPIVEVPNICKLALFTDPDNNRFQLVENLENQ